MQQARVDLMDTDFIAQLSGRLDENFKIIEDHFQVTIVLRDNQIVFIGDEGSDIDGAKSLVQELYALYKSGQSIDTHTIKYSIGLICSSSAKKLSHIDKESIIINAKGAPIRAKTLGQKQYLDNIASNDVTVCVGPAGTGKTYLAVAMAYKALKCHQVERIILTRPAVEAGESLGFLPGDLKMKVDPYLRPLYDALFDMMGAEKFAEKMEKGIIEVAPLAYMRGRTLDNSFIILDEAQNTTREQMKMFLTRLGFGSKAVVTGDLTQTDLPQKKSGLREVTKILGGIEGIAIGKLTDKDVVRHELVQKIIRAYENYEQGKESSKQNRRNLKLQQVSR